MSVWIEKYIKPNKYSRPQTKLKALRKIIMHYTANNGASAMNHYNYFNGSSKSYASAHFFVDKNEKLLIIPLDEIAYHANDTQRRDSKGNPIKGIKELLPNANLLSVGIEMCLEKDGTIHPNTIKNAEEVAVELCKIYNLNPLEDIVRHYDVTFKNCPAPWVKDEELFIQFKNSVNTKVNPIKETVINMASVVSEVIKEGEKNGMKLELTRGQLEMIATVLKEARVDGLLSDDSWEVKAKNGELTISDAVFLALIIDHRRFRDFVKE